MRTCALSIFSAVAIVYVSGENFPGDLARCMATQLELEAEILDLKESRRSLVRRNAELEAELKRRVSQPDAVAAPVAAHSGPSNPSATRKGGGVAQLPSHSSARKPPASRRADALRRQPVSAKGRQLAGHPSLPSPFHACSRTTCARVHTPKPLSAWQVHRQQIGLSCALEGRPH